MKEGNMLNLSDGSIIEFDEIEDQDTKDNRENVISVNEMVMTLDSQEPIIYPSRIALYGVRQLRKQYISGITTVKFFNKMLEKLIILNKILKAPIVFLRATQLFTDNRIEEPANFWGENVYELPLTFIHSNNIIKTSASELPGDADRHYLTSVCKQLENLIYEPSSYKKGQIVYFNIMNIHLFAQIDLWKFLLMIKEILKNREQEDIIFEDYYNELPLFELGVYLFETLNNGVRIVPGTYLDKNNTETFYTTYNPPKNPYLHAENKIKTPSKSYSL
jgi:hypothetical protein